ERPWNRKTSPGVSSVPASSEPTMAQSAPAATALARSPEYLMPPSAITGVLLFFATSTESMIAVSCGTPTPATMRVVQIEPGPMPTLMASAPASISAFGGGDVARDHLHRIRHPFDPRDRIEHAAGVAVRGVDNDKVDAGFDQSFAARKPGFADRRGGGNPQPALLV